MHLVGFIISMKLADKSFENMVNFKYLGKILTKLEILLVCKKKLSANYI